MNVWTHTVILALRPGIRQPQVAANDVILLSLSVDYACLRDIQEAKID